MRKALVLVALAGLSLLFLRAVTMGARMEAPRALGEVAPAFSLTDVNDNRLTLAELRGRPVLVNVWATWCPPCRAELPELQRLADERPGCLAVVGVTVNSGAAGVVAAFARERKLSYPLLIDDGSAALAYRIVTLPHSVLVAPDGSVAGRFRGAVTAAGVRSALADLKLPARPSC